MDPLRDRLVRIARQAIDDPSRASDLARAALAEIDAEAREANIAPQGYTYAGAHTFIAPVKDLEVEPFPATDNDPTGVPIWTTANQPVQIKIPFDVWIYAVASWAVPSFDQDGTSVFLSTCPEGRDLIAIDWGLDTLESYVTDGDEHGRMIAPASVLTGTRLRPRALSWKLQRNQVIQVRFRNLINAHLLAEPEQGFPTIASAAVAFYAVNLEMS